MCGSVRSVYTQYAFSESGQQPAVLRFKSLTVKLADENLYVGTSAGEIIHFVEIENTFVEASRQHPAFNQPSPHGVQQILLLPSVNKACILCNNTLTFYTLPELSPAYSSFKPLTCTYVGGVDEDLGEENDNEEGPVIIVCMKNRMRLVRVGEDGPGPRGIKSIEYGGGLAVRRRSDVACAADAHSYVLLDVQHQQKVPLFPISSLDEATVNPSNAPQQLAEPSSQQASRSASVASTSRQAFSPGPGHGRSTSLGIFGDSRRLESPRPRGGRYGFDAPDSFARSRSPFRVPSPEGSPPRPETPAQRNVSPEKPLPPPPPAAASVGEPSKKVFVPLKPLIASPTSGEFLLTTGTSPFDPGVGMFVNLDGDVVRGTIEFGAYPGNLIVDGQGIDPSASIGPGETPEEGYILASITKKEKDKTCSGIEIQRWDLDSGENAASKEWIDLSAFIKNTDGGIGAIERFGIRQIVAKKDTSLREVGQKLLQTRLDVKALKIEPSSEKLLSRAITEDKGAQEYAERLSHCQTRIVVWAENQIWWLIRSPLVLKLDARLDTFQSITANGQRHFDRTRIEQLVKDIRGLERWTEVDFLGLSYIRQKVSLLLFMDLITRTASNVLVFEHEKRSTEDALVEGEIDPRIILAMLPILRDEVVQGPKGISIQGGLKDTIEAFLQSDRLSQMSAEARGPFGDNILQLLKRYLLLWRKKKGLASVSDEKEVSYTVDASLLHVLLLLDKLSPKGPATAGSLRAELNAVVDSGVDCFDRAVSLLTKYRRLYVLSRLYQSKHMSSEVLATWKRILDGEPDDGGEFVDGEQAVRKYLKRVGDSKLVEEYGSWLAQRNPTLGVQVFADDTSKIKFQPAQAVAILKAKAPEAVKEYLEYLVFGKKVCIESKS
jgi:vacuolar protein sorting-associated protein 3